MLKKMLKKIAKKFFNKSSVIKREGDFYLKEYNGIKIYSHDLDCINKVFNQVFNNHIYNFETQNESPLIIDAGSNIGLGVLYWKSKYPKSKIIAFEPSKLNFISLEKNVAENKLEDVICINKALSNENGVQQFTTNEKISGSLVLGKNLDSKYNVETVKLGEFLKNKVDLLKIDIEGAEKLIYEDVSEHINNVDNIFLEYHSFIDEGQYLSKYLRLFEDNHYRYFIEDEYKKKNHFVNNKVSLNQDMQLNIWAKKNGS